MEFLNQALNQAFELKQTAHFWIFFLMVFGIIALPGLDMAYVLASSLRGGKTAGWAAVLGVVAGGVAHTAMAVAGVGVVVGAVPQLFNLMLLAGAAYIGWIGWSLLRGAQALGDVALDAGGNSRGLVHVFARGAATCLVNPKAYAFTLAVFPQFLKPEFGSMALQSLLLGGIISLTQLAIYGAVALAASSIFSGLRQSGRLQVRAGQAVGVMLILGALWTGWRGWQALG